MTMEIVVRGRNVEVDPVVDADSRRKLSKFAKLASDIRRIDVEFSEVRNPRVTDSQQCEVTVHLTRNLVKAHAAAADARTALDRVVEKVGHQLDRVHDKRVHRSRPRHPAPPEAPPDVVG
jgi:ribosomal subunit interface protein